MRYTTAQTRNRDGLLYKVSSFITSVQASMYKRRHRSKVDEEVVVSNNGIPRYRIDIDDDDVRGIVKLPKNTDGVKGPVRPLTFQVDDYSADELQARDKMQKPKASSNAQDRFKLTDTTVDRRVYEGT